MIDIAKRVHDHQWKIDPIIRFMLDTDFYKLLMAQMVLKRHADVEVEFQVINRHQHIRLAEEISEDELRAQLNHVRNLRLTRGEITWLRGNTFYGQQRMFSPEFVSWLEKFTFPDFTLRTENGQFVLTFKGKWHEVMMWEMPVLSIISELRTRASLNRSAKFDLQVLYARATSKLWDKVERLRKIDGLSLADFGTRRRHSFLWQDWSVQALIEGLGDKFLGTSNCHIALRREVEAIGTNAHELPMVYAALAANDEELAVSPYKVLADWQEDYDGNLRIILPDTYGTKNFLQNAPSWLASWTGMRVDSGDNRENANLAIDWWQAHGEDPREKLIIFSDGLDVDEIEALSAEYSGKTRIGFGWGTLLTNDFRGLGSQGLNPISIVCKAISANGSSTVKLSDNIHKAMGSDTELERYIRVFGKGAERREEVEV